MRRNPLALPVLGVTLLACSAASPTDSLDQSVVAAVSGPIALRSLQPGDVLTVHLDSEGCFHAWGAHLRFEADAERNVHISGRAGPSLDTNAPVGVPSAIGQLRPDLVAASLLPKLDQVLERLRAPQTGYCTTQTDYRLSLYRDGALVREEHLHDSMCGGFPQEDKATFFEFVGPALEQAYSTLRPRISGA